MAIRLGKVREVSQRLGRHLDGLPVRLSVLLKHLRMGGKYWFSRGSLHQSCALPFV